MRRRPHPFGAVLSRLRLEQGFQSAHAFYKARQGRRSLGLSFPNYLALERGRSLPKPRRVPALLRALGLYEASAAWQELVRSYLTSVLGSEELLQALASPPAVSPELISGEVVRQSMRQRAVQLDLRQWRLLAADPTAYYCHVYLINSPGWCGEDEVARAVKQTVGRVRRSLKALAAARIVELKGAKARSPMAYKCLQALPALPELLPIRAPILKSREEFAAGRGTLVHHRNVTTRLSLSGMERYFLKLSETVALAGVCGNAEKADDTDVYFVDARIFRVFD